MLHRFFPSEVSFTKEYLFKNWTIVLYFNRSFSPFVDIKHPSTPICSHLRNDEVLGEAGNRQQGVAFMVFKYI